MCDQLARFNDNQLLAYLDDSLDLGKCDDLDVLLMSCPDCLREFDARGDRILAAPCRPATQSVGARSSVGSFTGPSVGSWHYDADTQPEEEDSPAHGDEALAFDPSDGEDDQ